MNLFDAVQEAVDLTKIFPFTAVARQFEGYWLDRCIAPDHQDAHRSMLVFPDGVHCQACGYRRSPLGVMLQLTQRPLVELAEELLQDTEAIKQVAIRRESRILKELPQTTEAEIYLAHIGLATNSEWLAQVESFGFTRKTIQKWKLGVQVVWVRLDDDTFEQQPRITVPAYQQGKLVNVLYRKLYDDQKGAKVQLVKGAGIPLFNSDALRTVGQNPVVVVEGWGDVLALDQIGITAVTSLGGAGHWSSSWEEDLMLVRAGYRSGDADNAGLNRIKRLRKHLPWFLPLPAPFPKGTKKDWRDFVREGGTHEEFLTYIKRAPVFAAQEKLALLKSR